MKNRGNYVTKMVGVPSILVECGFLTNRDEAKKLADKGYQTRTARGITEGIFRYISDAMADPMFGIQVPVKPERERILSQSARDRS